MKKMFNMLSLLLMITIFLIGCTKIQNTEINQKMDSGIQTQNKENLNLEIVEKNKLLDRFKEKFPDATIYNDAMFDIDKDNSKELIVIFDTTEKKVNIAFLNQKGVRALSIGEGNGYSFDYILDSMKFDELTNYLFITLREKSKGFTIDYKITVEYNNKNKETNFIVESLNERRE